MVRLSEILVLVLLALNAGWSASWREQVETDWLRQDALRLQTPGAGKVAPEDDAAGAVDGHKTGKWGFHTDVEKAPWWQVDLQSVHPLSHLQIYNRGDGFAERATRIQVLLSEDGQNFQRAYLHDGAVFSGATPLRIDLHSKPARYVRLTAESGTYFHLDEVEVFAPGARENLALRKPATQSSVSQWSARHLTPRPNLLPMDVVIERGVRLGRSQQRLGADTSATIAELLSIQKAFQGLPADSSDTQRRELYFRARWVIRTMALANPLLTFDQILFVKRAPGIFPHMSDQFYGWWSRPGGGVFVLQNYRTSEPKIRCLTKEMPVGSFMGPEVAFDGRKILFSACVFHPGLANERNKADKANVPESAFYHLFEADADGSNRRQLTAGKYDDFEPRYLPSGDVLFLSTRKGTTIQCSDWFADSTRREDRADSYVRCGGDNYRPVPVFTMHALHRERGCIRSLSAFENFEWAPSIADDGRILYTRWDYIDRFNGHFFSLWSANQDGSNAQLVYGNYTVQPQVKFQARSIPGSAKLVFTAGAHHSNSGGTLCLLDRAAGTEGAEPITRITPDVRFPETEANDEHYYDSPWPLSEEYFLVGWADAKLPPHGRFEDASNPPNAMGIYLLDVFGNMELLYRDPGISCMTPMPLAPRRRPPLQPALASIPGASNSTVFLQDVYQGLPAVSRGAIKRLRIVGVVPKVQPHMNTPVLGVSAEDPGKFVLGSVPVHEDGSAFFMLPSGVPVFFQALDQQGLAVQTMRTLTYTRPGQTLSCVGCHEHRESAPPPAPAAQALTTGPSHITPAPEGSWPLDFARLVQPVLDNHCAECHQPSGKTAPKTKLDLSAGHAWESLMKFGNEDLKTKAFERDQSHTGEGVAANSLLWKTLTAPGGHHDVQLSVEDRDRLATWMDTYAHRVGHFSDQQAADLLQLRQHLAHLLQDQ